LTKVQSCSILICFLWAGDTLCISLVHRLASATVSTFWMQAGPRVSEGTMSDIKNGTVKFYNGAPDKRYGFIEPEGGGRDIFFHLHDYGAPDNSDRMTSRTPMKGDKLAFKVVDAEKGSKATPWAFADEMPVTINGTDLQIELTDIPFACKVRANDVVVAVSNRCFGWTHNGVGWTEVIHRPSDDSLHRVHCYDNEDGGSHPTYYNQSGDLPPNVVITGL